MIERTFPVLVLMVLLFQGCTRPKVEYALGPAFEGGEEAPLVGALVYVYWAPEDVSPAKRVWVMPLPHPIQRGGYSLVALSPGDNLLAPLQDAPRVYFDLDPGIHEIKLRAREIYFFRIEPRRHHLLFTHFDVRPVEAAVALPEIRTCRRMVEVPSRTDAAGNVASGS